ncbi:MAG: peptidoglycan DD-metalloendopeptidase family protein [Deltaproteobacteria bacterium]|nr:peptidoglycan DD-metalloendopeptidase family protein [Deltaproteobacteria bacterium]
MTWEKGNKGIVFTKRERPYEIERKTAGGIIDTTLFNDGARAGLDESLLSQLVDIFSWDVDFDKDIQRGDTFRVVYEERVRKGSARKPLLRILAAELVSAGQQYVAIYFDKEKNKGGYYDLEGRSLARAFLRFPLEFTRISSFFSHSRVNPILKVDRPHHGVDFVAGRGTAVRAIGDGKVVFAGWRKGGYGRMIELQHGFEYATRYAHLQGFAKGTRSGISVKKGQVIGYVGSSGLTTGTHLHFELYKDQQYVDPLKFEFPREDRIEPGLRRAFEDLKQILLAQLAATPHS